MQPDQHPIHPYDKASIPVFRGTLMPKPEPVPLTHPVRNFLGPAQVDHLLDVGPSWLDAPVGKDLKEWPVPSTIEWLYDLVWNGLQDAAQVFGLDITGMYESALVLKYGKRAANSWHTDYGVVDRSKVAVSLVLSDPSEYKGGHLELVGVETPYLGRGDALFFPGWLGHQVKPITKGERIVLVAWAGGRALR